MVRKLEKHIIEGITVTITQKMKRTGFSNPRVYIISTKIVNIVHLNTFKIINEELFKSNELRAEVNPGILSHPTRSIL